MANIKLNLAAAPFTGQLVTFCAPCSCADVTEGLVINGETYTVCDAMGVCVTGIGGAWCEGATITVALDVENKKAYLQNGASVSNANKGVAGGLATLDADGKVTAEQASAAMIDITESRALLLTDSGRLLCVESETDVVFTIPAESETAFPIGTELEVCQIGAGAVSFAAAEGVTILSVGGAVMIAEQYGCVTLKKLAADKWLLAGMLG